MSSQRRRTGNSSNTSDDDDDYPLPEWRFEITFSPQDPFNTYPGRFIRRYPTDDETEWTADFKYSVVTPVYGKRVGYISCQKLISRRHRHPLSVPHLIKKSEALKILRDDFPNTEIRLYQE